MITSKLTYAWGDNWARIPSTPSGTANGRMHAVCVTRAGNVVVFHQAQDGLLTFAPNGDIYGVEWIVGGRITKLTRRT